MLQNVKCQQAK